MPLRWYVPSRAREPLLSGHSFLGRETSRGRAKRATIAVDLPVVSALRGLGIIHGRIFDARFRFSLRRQRLVAARRPVVSPSSRTTKKSSARGSSVLFPSYASARYDCAAIAQWPTISSKIRSSARCASKPVRTREQTCGRGRCKCCSTSLSRDGAGGVASVRRSLIFPRIRSHGQRQWRWSRPTPERAR